MDGFPLYAILFSKVELANKGKSQWDRISAINQRMNTGSVETGHACISQKTESATESVRRKIHFAKFNFTKFKNWISIEKETWLYVSDWVRKENYDSIVKIALRDVERLNKFNN